MAPRGICREYDARRQNRKSLRAARRFDHDCGEAQRATRSAFTHCRTKQSTRSDEQDARLKALMAFAEIHEAHFAAVGLKIEKNSEQIAALTAAIADLDRRWQAYINTLPRQ
jgi:hypothetical protein